MSEIFSLQDKDIWVFGGAGYLGQAIVTLLHFTSVTPKLPSRAPRSGTRDITRYFIMILCVNFNLTASEIKRP